MQIQESNVVVSSGSAVTIVIPVRRGERLFSVELVEDTTSGGHFYDVGAVFLQYGGDSGASIRLSTGFLSLSHSCRWQGDFLAEDAMPVKCVFYYPPSGDLCKVRWITGRPDERFFSNESINVVQAYPMGMLRVLALESAAAATTLAARPDAGKRWLVQYLYAQHDDNAGAHNLSWRWTDGTNISNVLPVTSIAQNLSFSLSLVNGLAANLGPVYISRETYPTVVSADALGAGKKFYIGGVVSEFAGA